MVIDTRNMKATKKTKEIAREFITDDNEENIYTDVVFVGYYEEKPVYEAIFDGMDDACVGYPLYIIVLDENHKFARLATDAEGQKITASRK